jgi:tRNA1(Val) A37 N6-methylase TrmN6
MTSTSDAELSRDAFLGGALQIWQPRRGYRAGVDPVLLAASVTASAGEAVLELGCGAGVVVLCLMRRVPGLTATGLELQAGYADLARRNGAENGLALQVVEGDLQHMPRELRARSFDHVLANPPYFRRGQGTAAGDAGRETALGEGAALAIWVDAAVRRLRPGGLLWMVQRVDRMADLLRACDSRLGDLRLLPVAPRAGRAAELVILRARKGAKGPLRLLAPLILHAGDKHLKDGEDYRPEINATLRDGAQLPVEWA